MLYLGVDGGSTKIDFLVADKDLNIIAEYRLYEGSNLKYVGAEKIVTNLTKGFEKIGKQLQQKNLNFIQIKKAYLGIAECGTGSNIQGRDKIINFLETQLQHFTLEDDQYSVFRSTSSGKFGVLANAGTGSNINNFTETNTKTVKSVAYGGRDFGKTVLDLIKFGEFNHSTQVYKLVKKFLNQDPIDFYDNLSGINFVINKQITGIGAALSKEYNSNQQLQKELEQLLKIMGSRWGSKISSYCATNFGYKENDKFEIVLTGGLWNWKVMREITISEIKKTFTSVTITYQPKIKAVWGCIKLSLKI